MLSILISYILIRHRPHSCQNWQSTIELITVPQDHRLEPSGLLPFLNKIYFRYHRPAAARIVPGTYVCRSFTSAYPMAATSNRFEALLEEEEEIELDDADLHMDELASVESDASMAAIDVSCSMRKKTVSFKTVRKRGKASTKTKLKAHSSAVSSSEAKSLPSISSPLFRTSLASTFDPKSPVLVSLTKPRSLPSVAVGVYMAPLRRYYQFPWLVSLPHQSLP
jgi:hypothetical protein